MAYKFKRHKMEDGNKFGPSPDGRYYQPAAYHNPVKKVNRKGKKAKNSEHEDKTHWVLNKSQQYDVFLEGESNEFIDKNRGIFSFLDDCKEILGRDGERLSIFETPRNTNDAWHGYPFFSKDEDKLTDEMIDKFKKKGKISIANYTRLLARKI